MHEFRARGIRLALLTNGAAESQRDKVERFGLETRLKACMKRSTTIHTVCGLGICLMAFAGTRYFPTTKRDESPSVPEPPSPPEWVSVEESAQEPEVFQETPDPEFILVEQVEDSGLAVLAEGYHNQRYIDFIALLDQLDEAGFERLGEVMAKISPSGFGYERRAFFRSWGAQNGTLAHEQAAAYRKKWNSV